MLKTISCLITGGVGFDIRIEVEDKDYLCLAGKAL